MSSGRDRLVAKDLFEDDVVRDPFPTYDNLRPFTPFSTEDDVWLVMKYFDVFDILRDHETFSSDVSHLDNPVLRETPMIFEDPPAHTYHRKLVQHAFTNTRVNSLRPWITGIAGALFDETGGGEVDVVPGLCEPLPIKVIANIMGIPDSEYATFKYWADQRTFLVTGRGRPGASTDTERWASAELANRQLLDYFVTRAQASRAQPIDDLITTIANGDESQLAISDATLASLCALLLTAGNVTTTHLLANMFGQLADHPDIYASARRDPTLVGAIVEEALRLESPVQWLYRRAIRDVDLRGALIKEGSLIIVYFGAANRDPDVFRHPDRFEIRKRPPRHAAFGHGIHFCLGAPLARLEVSVALELALKRFDAISRTSTSAIRATRSATQFGYASLPLVFDRSPVPGS